MRGGVARGIVAAALDPIAHPKQSTDGLVDKETGTTY